MNKYLNPLNYWRKVVFYKDKFLYWPFYRIEKIRDIEIDKFVQYGFSYQKSLDKINKILEKVGRDKYHTQDHMASIHWLLFSAISNSQKIENILEIGTFDGQTTVLLSELFPDAKITTIDLPDDDPIFVNSYMREDEAYRADFLVKQAKNTENENILLIKKNSFFLNEVVNKKFDLIWVDGGHLYPEVSWDICNAYHLCSPNGWLMFDDIIPNKKYKQDAANSDSYSILEYIRKRMKYEITYFLKRDKPEYSANPKKRKYVALMHKI